MTPDIEALIHKAKKSLGAARSLVEDGYFDFAAARAYYAMFYVAEALLAFIDQSYNKHSAVISGFGREYAKTGKLDAKYHRWLIDAQDFRNIGDYAVDANVSEDDANMVCGWAHEFIESAEDLLSEEEQ
jgi:uncharacterized protein (UPF0332 family)